MENKPPPDGMGLTFTVGQNALIPTQAFRIAVLAKLGGLGATSATLSPDNDVDTVLHAIRPDVSLYFDPSPVETLEPLEVHIRIHSLKDLTPAGIVAQVPALGALVQFRQQLDLVRGGELTEEAFSADLGAYQAHPELRVPIKRWEAAITASSAPESQAPTASKPPPATKRKGAKDATLDRVFDMLAAEGREPQPSVSAKSTVSEAVSSIVGKRKRSRIDVEPARKATSHAINAILDAILHHPNFQCLEATVRGLRFLRSRVREGFEIIVADTRNLDLPEAFRRYVNAPLASESTKQTIDLAMIENPVRRTAPDLAMLQELGDLAEDAQVPTLVGLASDFFEIEGEKPSSLRMLKDHPAFLPWKALRQKPCTRWIVATFNPFLLRTSYSQSSTRGLEYQESLPTPAALPWGHASWLVVERLLAASVAHGWPTAFEGQTAGCVEALELYNQDEGVQIPLQLTLSHLEVLDIAELGITTPTFEPNRDRVYILRIPVVFEAPRLTDADQERQSRRMARLDFQLVAVRLIRLLADLRPQLEAETTPLGKAALLRTLLLAKVSETGRDAEVSVTPSTEVDGRAEVMVRLGGKCLDGVPIGLQVSL